MQSARCFRATRGWLAQGTNTNAIARGTSRYFYFSSRQRQEASLDCKGEEQPVASSSRLQIIAPSILIPHKQSNKRVKGKERQSKSADGGIYTQNDTSFDQILSPKGTISLAKLEAYIGIYCTNHSGSLLSLLLWVLHQKKAPLNDIADSKRRFHVYLYRRAELDQKRLLDGVKGWENHVPNSIDILCADILKIEVKEFYKKKQHLELFRQISRKAVRVKAHRTLDTIGTLLASSSWREGIKDDEDSQKILLQLQDDNIVSQAQKGQWDTLWEQKEKILNMLKEQKKHEILRRHPESDLQIDCILIKSLLATRVGEVNADFKKDNATSASNRETFSLQIRQLHEEISDIYGHVSARWLSHLVKGVASRLDMSKSSKLDESEQREVFNERQIEYELVMSLFNKYKAQVQKEVSSKVLRDAMLVLQMKLLDYGKRWPDSHQESTDESSPVQKHLAEINRIAKELFDSEEKEASDDSINKERKNEFFSNDFSGKMERKARMIHLETRFAFKSLDYKQSLQKLQSFLDELGPDESYHEHVKVKEANAIEKQVIVARAMMNTRRLMRGAIINILVQVVGSTSIYSDQEVDEIIALLLQIVQKSIFQGLWDPWILKNANARRNLKLFNVTALLIDPPSELSGFFSRLLSAVCPIRAVHKNTVIHGCQLYKDGNTASTYWSTVSALAEVIQIVGNRRDHLAGQELLPKDTTHPEQKPFTKVFTQEGVSSAKAIWSIFIGVKGSEEERDRIILSRLSLILDDLYLPLKIPPRAWKAARLALRQVCDPGNVSNAERRKVAQNIWTLFNKAEKIGLGKDNVPLGEAEGEIDHARLKLISRNKDWRLKQWKKKRYPM